MTILFAPFALFLPGYLFLKSIWGKNEKLSFWEAIMLSIALSFLFAYPLGIANNLIEYNQNPYQVHIDTLFPLYLFLCAGLYFISRKKKTFHDKFETPERKWLYLIISIFTLAVILRIYGNAYQNINQDEQELSLYSYNLIDGILVGRKAFFLSSTVHSPLGFFISFIIYSLVIPFEYFHVSEYILRTPMLVFGMLELAMLALFAKKLKLSKSTTAFGLFLLAINTYAIFGSRLMIPQDGSIFTFYILIFSYFFIRFLDQESKPTKLDIFIIGLLAASTILVKLAAIFLIPPFIFFWILKRKGFKNLLRISLVTIFFFSPVIIFNVLAYKMTGYTDVPTAKLLNFFGIHANSLMNNEELYGAMLPPFFKTMLGFIEMLADQWSLLLTINLFLSIPIILVISKKMKARKTTIYFFMSVFFVSLIFFSLNGYRAYYAEYLTLPLLLFSLIVVEELVKKHFILKISLIFWSTAYVISSFTYTINSHIIVTSRPDSIQIGEFGRSEIYTYEQFNIHRSLASWSFLRDDGFPTLKEFLHNKENTFLVIEDSFLFAFEHHFRWYLGIHDDVTQYYLGDAYNDDFEYTTHSKYDFSRDAIEILEYAPDKIQKGDLLINNHNNRPKMIIRYLKKQEFLSPVPSTSI